MLRLDAIGKRFGSHRALAGVSLEVATGRAVLLVGRNGAGKTTLLRVASGYLDPDEGAASIDGIALGGDARDRARAQRRLGYLPEHAPAPPELAVVEHLMSRARLKGLGRDAGAAVARAVAAAAIGEVTSRRIATLSKGFRQRVGLADALLGEPPLVLLDEPTSGMDPVQTRELREHLAAAAQKRALLVSSHAVADLEAIATHVAVLRDGALVAFSTKPELCARASELRHRKIAHIADAVLALLDEPGEGREGPEPSATPEQRATPDRSSS